MKRFLKQFLVLLLTLTVLSTCLPVSAANVNLKSAVSGSAAYMLKTVSAPQVGSIGGEWAVIGLARSGYAVPQTYWDAYYSTVESYVKAKNGILHEKKYTEYSRVILALTAIGADPSDVAGYNLLTPLGDFDKTVWQGINGPIWALIALDSGSYPMPVNAAAKTKATRQLYVNEILSRQNNDGGWNLTSKGGNAASDPDVTAMALQALAKYQSQSAVKNATNKALTCLSKMQEADGGYASYKTSNSESVVQVIVALCHLGISLEDNRFVKNGHTLFENLLSYWKSGGSFAHTTSGTDQMASEQGLYGLVAALRAAEGKNALYAMGDCTISVSGVNNSGNGLLGKHADVRKTTVTTAGKTFADIQGHANQAAIEALVARGIISGMSTTSYAPNNTMTRAQFASIVIKSLGLTPKAVRVFTDVPASQWYAPYVGTAYSYGIITGKTKTSFDPSGTISRQEAAVMVARAAKLCGMDTELSTSEINTALSRFGDQSSVDQWARGSLAFCYSKKILSKDKTIQPKQAVLRCEVAQMLYNLLNNAKLL